MGIPIETWSADVNGRFLDRDSAPVQQPYQCHDVWLDYANRVHDMPVANPNLGWAPGNGYTNQVWRQFPAVSGVEQYFRKKYGTAGLGRGDVVFWDAYQGGLPHVAVALGPIEGDTFLAVSQNPGVTRITRLTAAGVIGYLEPLKPVGPAPGGGGGATVQQLVDEVFAGLWGNGDERRDRLTAAGYDYGTVQAAVNARAAASSGAGKSVDELAHEVIAGIWGNGEDRRAALTASGYDYGAVQGRVNALLGGDAPAPSGRRVIVDPGDSLSSIAQQFGSTWQAIYAANRAVIGDNPNRIFPGQELVIP